MINFYNQNKINFLQWNTQGVNSKRSDLLNLLDIHKIDIVLLSETFLKTSEFFNVNNFYVERCDRPLTQTESNRKVRAYGGAAILIRNTYGYERINIVKNPTCEIVAIKLFLGHNRFLYIISVYALPNHKINRNEWNNMLSRFNDGPTILAGDINAHHLSWDSSYIGHCFQGEELFEYIETNDKLVVNDSTPTRVHRPGWRDSVIDLTIMSSRLSLDVSGWRVCKDSCGSDHYPIIFSVGNIDPKVRYLNLNKKIYKKANWTLFTEKLKNENDTLTTYRRKK